MRDYKIPGELGKEYNEAAAAYRAEQPKPSKAVGRRYGQIKGVLEYLIGTKKLKYEQLADMKLEDALAATYKKSKANRQ